MSSERSESRGVTKASPTSATKAHRRTQAQRTAETKNTLIRATIDVLYELGYSGATTAAIADRAGISRGSITHQFGTRAALMAEVVRWVYRTERESYYHLISSMANQPSHAEWVSLCWLVLSKPSGLAVIEILLATRRDADLAEQVMPMQRLIEEEALSLVSGSATSDADVTLRLDLMRMIVWSVRGLSIARLTVCDEPEIQRVVELFRKVVISATDAKLLDPSP